MKEDCTISAVLVRPLQFRGRAIPIGPKYLSEIIEFHPFRRINKISSSSSPLPYFPPSSPVHPIELSIFTRERERFASNLISGWTDDTSDGGEGERYSPTIRVHGYSPRIDQSIGNEHLPFLRFEIGHLDGRFPRPKNISRDPIDRQSLGIANFRQESLGHRSVVRQLDYSITCNDYSLLFVFAQKKRGKINCSRRFTQREETNLTADVARISLPVHTIDIDRDRHLHVRYVNRASGILVRRREWNPQRGHSLIHQQEVGLVFGPRFAVGPIPGEAFVTHAGELILPSRDACRVRRTDRGVVSARGLRQARETVAVVALKLPKIPSSS